MSLEQIRSRFGPEGVNDFAEAYGRLGTITDDTQMTLFTAEGILRCYARWRERGIASPAAMLHEAYLRWLKTQGMSSAHASFAQATQQERNGWLLGVRALYARRAPGNTCLVALCSAKMGTIERPLNDSKGCGGVMRVAPAGLACGKPEKAFDIGCEAAAITHGHPSGYLSAGCLAAVIAGVIDGRTVLQAAQEAMRLLRLRREHDECLAALRGALDLASRQPRSSEAVESMGGGWVGEEALAISVYCALCSEGDFQGGVLLSVNHSGDSDSTGAITGNILGAQLGRSAIPPRWLEHLELRGEIERLAADLLKGHEDTDEWWQRYPGY